MNIIYTIGAEGEINKGLNLKLLRVMVTNDSKGKTLSIDNGEIQFSIPMEIILHYFVDESIEDSK